MRKKDILTAALVVGFAGVVLRATPALVIEQVRPERAAMTTGSVQIGATPVAASLTVAAMMPGDEVWTAVVVTNEGNQALRYAVVATTTTSHGRVGDAGGLQLAVKAVDRTTPHEACDDFDGAPVYDTGPLSGPIIGSTDQGHQSGDRLLGRGESEVLCLRTNLPLAAPDRLQGASTVATFTFVAEQTANNA